MKSFGTFLQFLQFRDKSEVIKKVIWIYALLLYFQTTPPQKKKCNLGNFVDLSFFYGENSGFLETVRCNYTIMLVKNFHFVHFKEKIPVILTLFLPLNIHTYHDPRQFTVLTIWRKIWN